MSLVHESLLASAEELPGKEAIVDEYTARTYAELADDSLRFARVLQDAGLQGGDRVALPPVAPGYRIFDLVADLDLVEELATRQPGKRSLLLGKRRNTARRQGEHPSKRLPNIQVSIESLERFEPRGANVDRGDSTGLCTIHSRKK